MDILSEGASFVYEACTRSKTVEMVEVEVANQKDNKRALKRSLTVLDLIVREFSDVGLPFQGYGVGCTVGGGIYGLIG